MGLKLKSKSSQQRQPTSLVNLILAFFFSLISLTLLEKSLTYSEAFSLLFFVTCFFVEYVSVCVTGHKE